MKSEIRFKDREHLAFYNMVLKQTRKDDPYHKAFFYVVGISSDTRNNIQKIFDFEEDCIRPDCINDGWQTSGTERITRLAGILTDTQRRMIFLTASLHPISWKVSGSDIPSIAVNWNLSRRNGNDNLYAVGQIDNLSCWDWAYRTV